MVLETWVQSKVSSYQRLWKWYLIPPCLTLSNIKYVTRIKWSNDGKGVAPHQHLGVVAIEMGAFWSPSTTVTNFNYMQLQLMHICNTDFKKIFLVKMGNNTIVYLFLFPNEFFPRQFLTNWSKHYSFLNLFSLFELLFIF